MECAGTKTTEEQCLLVTKKGGKIGFQGITYSDVLIKQRAFEKIFRSELTIKGFWNSYSAPFPGKEWFDSITFLENVLTGVCCRVSVHAISRTPSSESGAIACGDLRIAILR